MKLKEQFVKVQVLATSINLLVSKDLDSAVKELIPQLFQEIVSLGVEIEAIDDSHKALLELRKAYAEKCCAGKVTVATSKEIDNDAPKDGVVATAAPVAPVAPGVPNAN